MEDAKCVRSLGVGGSRSVFGGTQGDRTTRVVGIEMCGTAGRRGGVLGLVVTRRTALVPRLVVYECLYGIVLGWIEPVVRQPSRQNGVNG